MTAVRTRERPARAGADADNAAADAGSLGFRQLEIEVLPDGTVKRPDAAKFLGRRPQTLARWAARGVGPPYFLLGKFAFYPLAGLKAYKAKHSVERLPKQPDLI